MAINWYKDTEYTAVCSSCGDTESIYASDGEYKATDTPSKYFLRQGWREKKRRYALPCLCGGAIGRWRG